MSHYIVTTIEELNSEAVFEAVAVLPVGGPVRSPSSRIDGVNYFLEAGYEGEYNASGMFNMLVNAGIEPKFYVWTLGEDE